MMNNGLRLRLAQQHIKLLAMIDTLIDLKSEEDSNLDLIKNEERLDQAQEGVDKLQDIVDLLSEARDLFEEAAQGRYAEILLKLQRRQQRLQQEHIENQQKQRLNEQEKADRLRQREIAAFLEYCPNPDNPDGYSIDSLDEFFFWKYQDTGLRNKYDDHIHDFTPQYLGWFNKQTDLQNCDPNFGRVLMRNKLETV